MFDPRHDTVETCLEALAAGEDAQQLITRFPEMRPVLEAAAQANQLESSHIPVEIQQRSRAQVLAHATKLRTRSSLPNRNFVRLPRLALAALLALFAFLTWSSLMIVSARSLPGDQLYPVKRAVEDLRINLSTNSETLQHIEEQYRERRIEEIHQLLNRQRSELVSFDGLVSERGERHWTIGSVLVIVAPETVILGQIETGMLVEVEGTTQPQGWVRAYEIHLREFEITGVVEVLTDQVWMIADQEVQISPNTRIDPHIQIGTQVRALIQADDDGTLHAVQIIFLSPAATATPIPFPTSTADSTPTQIVSQDDDKNDNEHETETEENDDDESDESKENEKEDEEKDADSDEGESDQDKEDKDD